MARICCIALLLALAGCTSPPAVQPSPCAAGESSYACQVQRYHDVAQ